LVALEGTYVRRHLHRGTDTTPQLAANRQALWQLPIDKDKLLHRRRRLEDAVLASAMRARGGVPDAEQPLRQAGQELFEALFATPVDGGTGPVWR